MINHRYDNTNKMFVLNGDYSLLKIICLEQIEQKLDEADKNILRKSEQISVMTQQKVRNVVTSCFSLSSPRTGERCFLNFKPCGLFGKELHKVEGYIVDKR